MSQTAHLVEEAEIIQSMLQKDIECNTRTFPMLRPDCKWSTASATEFSPWKRRGSTSTCGGSSERKRRRGQGCFTTIQKSGRASSRRGKAQQPYIPTPCQLALSRPLVKSCCSFAKCSGMWLR